MITFSASVEFIEELAVVITAGKLRMSDDERLLLKLAKGGQLHRRLQY